MSTTMAIPYTQIAAMIDDGTVLSIQDEQGLICPYCEENIQIPEEDHLISLKHGGPDHFLNKITTCKRCNRRKNSHFFLQFLDLLIAEGNSSGRYRPLLLERLAALNFFFFYAVPEAEEIPF